MFEQTRQLLEQSKMYPTKSVQEVQERQNGTKRVRDEEMLPEPKKVKTVVHKIEIPDELLEQIKKL